MLTMPQLDGYDFTKLKPDGTSVLESRRNDPVLANWQYGLGRVVAWMADDGSDFAQQWKNWDRYDAFFASVLRWTLPDPEFRAVNTTVSRDGDAARFRFTATSAGGQTVDLEHAIVTVVGPGGGAGTPLPLVAVGTGIYEGSLPQAAEGAYQVNIAWPGSVTDQSAVVLPPSPELRPTFDGTALLASLSSQSGGDQLTLDENPSNLYAPIEHQDSGFASYRHTWAWFLSLGLFAALMEWSIRLGFWRRLEALFGSRPFA